MLFKKKGQIKMIMLLVMVILFYVIYRLINYFNTRHVNVPPALLVDVIKPGSYKGVGEYSATKSHSGGIVTTNDLIIEKGKNNSVYYTNTLIAKDKKTNKVQYNGVRKGIFFYKSNHGNQLFVESKSYIDDNIVSSQYGYANGITNNSISFLISSTWYIDQKIYDSTVKTLTRNGDNLSHSIYNTNKIGMKGLTIEEEYKLNK